MLGRNTSGGTNPGIPSRPSCSHTLRAPWTPKLSRCTRRISGFRTSFGLADPTPQRLRGHAQLARNLILNATNRSAGSN